MNRYSKAIVLIVILLNVAFLVYIRNIILTVGFEPTTLITAWFGFTGVELLALATITVTKVKQERRE